MLAINVWIGGKMIDTVFVSAGSTIAETVEETRQSLIKRDGYSHEIKCTWPKGQRITQDSYELQADYGHGWECVCSESTRKEVRLRLKEYRENEGGIYRIKVVREHK